MPEGKYPDPREEDIVYGDRRISRPDASLPDWEVPDTAYRPIPIVWFTGALFAHLMAVGLIILIFPSSYPEIEFGLCVLAAAGVAKWTWDRGMKDAGAGWKIATVAMLAINMLYVAAATFQP